LSSCKSIDLPGVNAAGNQATSGLATTATTAAVATTVTITDNEDDDEDNVLVFVAGADSDGGNVGLESDGHLHYNPSTGKLTATSFAGDVTGTITGTTSQINVTAVTDNDTVYPVFVTGTSGSNDPEVASALTYNPSTGVLTGTQFTGAVSGNATSATSAATLTTARDIGGVSFNGSASIDLPGVNSAGSQATSGTAALATAVTVTANDSEAADLYPVFVDGASGSQGIETDSGFTYNPNTGLLTALGFAGPITGNLTGTLQTGVQAGITTVGTIDTGTWQGTVIAEAYLPNAGAAVEGVVELAVESEITTGTDSSRAMPIDQYVASNRNVRYIFYRILGADTDVDADTTVGGDFEFPFAGTIIDVGTFSDTAGSSGTQVVDIHKNGTTIMGLHKCDTESGEKTTRDAGQPPVITVAAIAEGDILTFDVDTEQGTEAKGLTVRLEVRVT